MSRVCWFAALPDAGPCSGRLVRCHLIPRQLIARQIHTVLRDELDAKMVNGRVLRASRDKRCWVWGCGGAVGVGGHHGMLDASRTLRIPRHRLPAAVWEFASDPELFGDRPLTFWLEREYGGGWDA